ncbi:MAG TPA: aminotransferase class V-fold PLP-dependent enzyme [candidate division Zixibacteria bacterium]|nr:aminotransferase class V-fold PLP-dependent enzyme [candidate division Zixibacteria bacterium]
MSTPLFKLSKSMAPYRGYFPFKNVYLNTASIGPFGLLATKKLDEFNRRWRAGDTSFDEETFRMLGKIRRMCAKLIGAETEEIGFCPNTSYGLNVCIAGLDLKPGDEAAVSELEFPAGVYVLKLLEQKGVTTRYLKTEKGYLTPEELAVSLTPHTKVFLTSYVQFFNGYKHDLAAFSEICRHNGTLLVVDGIQGVGNQVLDVHQAGVDFLAAGGQKWLLSAGGTGFFYCSKILMEKLQPAYFSWMGVDWKLDWSDLWKKDLKPFDSARRFEIGSYPHQAIRHFYWSLMLLHKIGVAKIEPYNKALLDLLVDYLSNSPYHLRSLQEAPHRSSILSFTHPDVEKLVRFLKSKKIIVSLREGGVRVSANFYNTPEDIQRLVSELKRFGNRKISRK